MATNEWEYRRSSNPNSYDLNEGSIIGHKFSYIKRRRRQTESKYSGFQPYCSCKWKSKIWFANKHLAMMHHHDHVTEFVKTHPTLGVVYDKNDSRGSTTDSNSSSNTHSSVGNIS